MLRDLVQLTGSYAGTCDLLGCPIQTLSSWMTGEAFPSDAALRAVWFMWARIFRPELLADTWSIVTWGRFTMARRVKVDPERWSDWSI